MVRLNVVVVSELAHERSLKLHLLTLLQNLDYLDVIVPRQTYLARVLHHSNLVVLLLQEHLGLGCHIHLFHLGVLFVMHLDVGQLECKHLLSRVVRGVHKIGLVGWRLYTSLTLTLHDVIVLLSLCAHF